MSGALYEVAAASGPVFIRSASGKYDPREESRRHGGSRSGDGETGGQAKDDGAPGERPSERMKAKQDPEAESPGANDDGGGSKRKSYPRSICIGETIFLGPETQRPKSH
jgi:hypothetical protein